MKKMLKKIIPVFVVENVRKYQLTLDMTFVSLCGKNRYLAGLYYLFTKDFAREHQAVLQGRFSYYASLKDISETCALLRRNIHRLEKGLIMRPRKKIFGERFILETVWAYRDAVNTKKLNNAEQKWATDVLDEYFTVVAISKVISKAKGIYCQSRRVAEAGAYDLSLPSADGKYKPYQYSEIKLSKVCFEDIKKLFVQRRSVRWYEDRVVPLELVQKAANIASFAPSACNRQPYRFIFCNRKEKAVEIAKCAGGTMGFAENITAIITVVGDLSAYPFDRDRHVIYIDSSLAVMQLMLALETLGLSSCSINWPEVEKNEMKIRKIIPISNYERVVMLLAVGYADKTGGIPYSQKKTNELILENISL